MSKMFLNDVSFNRPLDSWNVHNVVQMQFMFSGASSFNQNISSWDMSSVTNMANMFSGASSFNQNLNSWTVSSVTSMAYMFNGSLSFNQPLNLWNVSQVTNMGYMFLSASSFNQNISSWNVSKVTNMASMFTGVSLSITNYDDLLLGWSILPLQSGVTLDAGNSYYSSTASSARQQIVSAFGWTINDNGLLLTPSAPQPLQDQPANGFVFLTWDPVNITGSRITSFTLYRSTTSGSGYTAIKTLGNSVFSYNDTGLSNGQTYYYVVTATNNAGVSPYSTEVSAMPHLTTITTTVTSTPPGATVTITVTNTTQTNIPVSHKSTPGFTVLTVLLTLVASTAVMYTKRKQKMP